MRRGGREELIRPECRARIEEEEEEEVTRETKGRERGRPREGHCSDN